MVPQINIYATQMTPKQKKDLLGIYQDYLHFVRGLEATFQFNNAEYLSYMFFKKYDWETVNGKVIPWKIIYTDSVEKEDYKTFVDGVEESPGKYTYISLVHTKEEDDVALPQVNYHPENYRVACIDMDLPCLVERYNIAYVPEQKMKDAVLLIDGKFKVVYTGERYKDMPVYYALNDMRMNAEFRVLLNVADYFDRHSDIVYRYGEKELYAKMRNIMGKITASETLSDFENVILDLMGAYGDKAQEIIRGCFPQKSIEEIWQAAQKAGLISSAESMQNCMNIRHLMRHQWDSLEGVGRYSAKTDKKNDNVRREYKKSYFLFFDKTMAERIKEYQKVSVQMQTLLKNIYPNFLTRETGESNSKFVKRLKDWQKENPTQTAMVYTNYPFNSDKLKPLVNNIKKVLPQTRILDNLDEETAEVLQNKENLYYDRSWFLSIYGRIETEMMNYCLGRGLELNRNETWNYFKKNVLSREQYDKWCEYRKLRNNLSHNHFNEELQNELTKLINKDFSINVAELNEYITQHSPSFVLQEDGTFLGIYDDGLQVIRDADNQILSLKYKDNKEFVQCKLNTQDKEKPLPLSVKLHWNENLITDCRLEDKMLIDLKHQKVCLADDSKICFDDGEQNFFRVGDIKLYTDKTFAVTDFYEKGRRVKVGRNESLMVSAGHLIRTDSHGRISEDIITLKDGKKFNIKFNYDAEGAVMVFPDGTKLNTSSGKFEISHNDVVLNYANRYAFMRSYDKQTVTPKIGKSGFER